MLHFISADVVAHGTRLHYYRTGGRKPPVVLLHGITDDGLCWTPVAEVLAERYDVVMVDLRGHGLSEAPEGGYTLENLATETAELIRALGLEAPAVLGHSMGAITTLVLAGLFPDLPRAILLEDPPGFWKADLATPEQLQMQQHLIEWMDAIKRKTHAELLAEGQASNPGWSEAEFGPWVEAKHRFSPKAAALITPADIVSIDFPRLVKRITCPAYFISADPQRGAAAHPADIAVLQAWLPQLQVTPIADAGHCIRRDQLARYLDVVQAALLTAPG